MTKDNRPFLRLRRIIQGGLAAAVALVGVAMLGAPAFAHSNLITGTVTCLTPGASSVSVSWIVANDYNLNESVTVTSATGGLGSVSPTAFSIVASGNGSGGYGSL